MSYIEKKYQFLVEFYKRQYEDINEMNHLDWRVALLLFPMVVSFSTIVGIVSSVIEKPTIAVFEKSIQAFSWLIFLICMYGLWTVAKGQVWVTLRYKIMREIERETRMDRFFPEGIKNPSKGLGWGIWRVIAARRSLLFAVYCFLASLSLSVAYTRIEEWNFMSSLHFLPWTLIPSSIIIVIQFMDWRVHSQGSLSKNCNRDREVDTEDIE